MFKEHTSIGIAGLATYLPDQRMSSAEIASQSGLPLEVVEQKLGIKEKTIPGLDDHTAQMGVWAAQKALAQAQIDPMDLDVVIYIGEEYKEYPLWTASIYMQQQLGASKAWAFDISLRCGTAVLAMNVAKALLLAQPQLKTVLLAGGYRNGDFIDLQNPRTRFMYNLAAGGGAIILQKGLEENVLLATEVMTDGSFAEDVVVPIGGTKCSPAMFMAEHGYYPRLQLDVLDPEGMKARLEEKSMRNFLQVVRKSLAQSGYQQSDLDYLAILHMKRSAHDYVLHELDLREDQAIYLDHIGHVGQFDQFISLEMALEQGKVKPGSLVSMVSAGIGYAWAANTIRWGRRS